MLLQEEIRAILKNMFSEATSLIMLGVDICWSAVPFERLSTSVSARQGFPVALRPVLELALID